jgi:hypothetical protein
VLPQLSGLRLPLELEPLAAVPRGQGPQRAELPRSTTEPGPPPLVRQPDLRVAASEA